MPMIVLDENTYHGMSEKSYLRPAQIPIRRARFEYLVNEYTPNENDEWIMFHHPNHFVIYSGLTSFCVFDAEYVELPREDEEDPLIAVISKIRINQDKGQCPAQMQERDGFGVLSTLINEKL